MIYLELKEMLLDRKYPVGIVEAAIAKAESIPRAVVIMRVERVNSQTSRRPVFVVPHLSHPSHNATGVV